MSAKLQPTNILHRPATQRSERYVTIQPALGQRRCVGIAIDRRGINPVIAKVVEVRVEALQKNARSITQPIVQRAAKPAAIAIVAIIAQVIRARVSWSGLHVINAEAIPVIRTAEQRAQLLSFQKPTTQRPIKLVLRSSANNRSVTTQRLQDYRRPILGAFGPQVYRPANTIAFHIGLQRLVDLNRLHQVGRNQVKLDLPHRLRRRNPYPIQRRIGQSRLCSANFYILAFALVALQRHAWQAPNCISNVRVRKARNHIRRQHVDNVVRVKRPIDRLNLASLPSGVDHHTFNVRGDL